MRKYSYDQCRIPVLKGAVILLCLIVCLFGVYAQRQRAWANDLHGRLVQANLDDMMLWRVLSWEEKQTISERFRERGESRIADWISKQ